VPFVLDPTLVRGLDHHRLAFGIRPDENASRSAAADATTASSGDEASTPGIGFGAGIERCCSPSRTGAPLGHAARRVFASSTAAHASAQTVLQQLRRAGIAADMDYGRSRRRTAIAGVALGASSVVILRESDAVVRAAGRQDETVALGEVVATLTAP
jgi:histidyl-tRNA synthetase